MVDLGRTSDVQNKLHEFKQTMMKVQALESQLGALVKTAETQKAALKNSVAGVLTDLGVDFLFSTTGK